MIISPANYVKFAISEGTDYTGGKTILWGYENVATLPLWFDDDIESVDYIAPIV